MERHCCSERPSATGFDVRVSVDLVAVDVSNCGDVFLESPSLSGVLSALLCFLHALAGMLFPYLGTSFGRTVHSRDSSRYISALNFVAYW